MIDQKYIDMIIDRADLEKVVAGYLGEMKRKGHRSWACCPFHQEKTPSFCVDTAKNLWHCYGALRGWHCHQVHRENREPAFPAGGKEAAEGRAAN